MNARPEAGKHGGFRIGPVAAGADAAAPDPASPDTASAASPDTASPDTGGEPSARRPGHAGQPGGGPGSLATRQAALVEALTSGNPVPDGFDAFRVEAARAALLRKRAGEVSRQWPMLAAGFGDAWKQAFAEWARTRPPQGSLRAGWDLARDLLARDALPRVAAPELAGREATMRYDGASAPKPRRAPAIRSAAGAVALQFAGRLRHLRS